jgi:hypothetical protein
VKATETPVTVVALLLSRVSVGDFCRNISFPPTEPIVNFTAALAYLHVTRADSLVFAE